MSAVFGVFFGVTLRVVASTVVAWGNPDNLQTNIPSDLTNAVAIGAGSAYGLALLQDGTVRSWGNDYAGAGPVPAITGVVAIASGMHHSLALKQDGTVIAWKYFFDEFGQANVPAGLSNVIAVAAGSYHSLALRSDGTVIGWGNNSSGQTIIPSTVSNVVAIAAGGAHNLALRRDGTVVYWGEQAAANSTLVGSFSNVVAISCGVTHAAVLFRDHTVQNWGIVTLASLLMPPDLTNVATINCGGYHTLALKLDGTVAAWGSNVYGQTDVPAGITNAIALAGGESFSAALTGPPSLKLLQQPANVIAVAGESPVLLASAAGTPPITWQWTTNDSPLAGATNSALTLANVQMSQQGLYSVTASNSAGTVQSVPAAVSVFPLIITSQPSPYTAYGGNSATFSVTTRNVGPIYYQWRHGLIAIPGATNASLMLSNVGTNDAGPYSVVITNAAGSVTSQAANLTVTPIAIALQPTNVTVYSGDQAQFFVLPWYNGPYTAQWRAKGVDIPGATNLSLTLTSVSTNDAGNYTVLVSNPYGSIESSNAALTVTESTPLITAQPTNDFAWSFGPASLRVGTTGSIPQIYQWRFNGADLAGATNSFYSISKATAEQVGLYSVIISNAVGFAVSSNALLTVVPAAVWGASPARPPATFADAAGITGNGSHGFALRSNGTVGLIGVTECQQSYPATNSNVMKVAAGSVRDILVHSNGMVEQWGCSVNATSTPASLTNVVEVQSGTSHFLALRENGAVTTWGYYNGIATNQAVRSVVGIGAGGDFDVVLKADGTVAAWGANLYRQTSVPVNLSNVVAVSCGTYHSIALKADGTVECWGASAPTNSSPHVNWGQTNVPAGLSNVVAVEAGEFLSAAITAEGRIVAWGQSTYSQTTLPSYLSNIWQVANLGSFSIGLISSNPITIARQPQSALVGIGERVILSAGVVSTAPASYRWQHENQDVPSGTNSVLIIAAASAADQGAYHVVVSNQFASVTSREAILNVAAIPTILAPPANQVVFDPGPASFSVTATSSLPIFYQWRWFSNIPGATNASLTLSNLSRYQSGYYAVTVSNLIGGTNVEARLRVVNPSLLSAIRTTTNGTITFTAQDRTGYFSASDIPFFTVQASTNLIDWDLVKAGISMGTNGVFIIQDPAAGDFPRRYYRVGEALTTRIPAPQKLSGPFQQSDGSMILLAADSSGVRLNANDLTNVKIFASTNLADWELLNGSMTVSNGVLILRDPGAKDLPRRFYRVEEQP